jgi:Family of unknown function (DUF6311)
MNFSARALPYGIGLAVGVLAALAVVPAATLGGAGGLFAHPDGDLVTNLIGHLAFQAPGWHWPLLRAPTLAWPAGEVVAFSDSNPALSLVAKMVASVRGAPANWFGVWLWFCIAAQPVAAVFALRGMRPAAAVGAADLVAALAAAIVALSMPAWLYRVGHINLFAHFLLLVALGFAARWCRDGKLADAPKSIALLTLAVLVHPYLFMFCVVCLAAPLLNPGIDAKRRRAGLITWSVSAEVAAGIFLLLSGTAGGNGPGYGLYSLNLLGPFWPQRSGLFGDSPILDATGYQYEGFNYLGAGAILLIAVAAGAGWLMKPAERAAAVARYRGLILAMGALTLLAATPRLTAGHWVLVPVNLHFLDRLLGIVRASGRAFWIVEYALALGAVAVLAARMRVVWFASVMVVVVVLQWVDAGPLRRHGEHYLAGVGQVDRSIKLPADTVLYRTVPSCGLYGVRADEWRLQALRAGARLADARLAHEPTDAACAARVSFGLGEKLEKGETRLFLPDVEARVRADALGAACGETEAGLLCHRNIR